MIDSLLTASLQGAVAVAIVWAVCRALPKLPANARTWLWRLVLVKFAVTLAVGLPVLLPSAPVPQIVAEPELAVVPEEAFAPIPELPPMRNASVVEPSPMPVPIPLLPLLWGIGVVAMVVRTGIGFGRARRLLQGSSPALRLEGALGLTRARANLRRPVSLRASADVATPVVLGLVHPVVIVPHGFEDESSEVVEAVLGHEVAHLARRDCEWSLLAEAVRILFWFHPLVWLAVREVRAETEIAADRLAREWTQTSPRDYAAALLTLVGRSAGGVRAPRVGAGALHATHELTRRFQAMALDRYSRRTLTRLSAFGALPLALTFAPLRVDSAPAMPIEQIAIEPAAGRTKPLFPLRRSHGEAVWQASREGLNTGGTKGPRAALEAVARLEREGVGKGTVKIGNGLEILGMSHIEPGRSRSWRIDGTPLPKLLPFGASSGIPAGGDFERQLVLRVRKDSVRGVKAFFRVGGREDRVTPASHERANILPIPCRLNGDLLLSVQQGFGQSVREADLVITYSKAPKPLTTLIAKDGHVRDEKTKWEGSLYSGASFASGERGFGRAPTSSDTVLSLRRSSMPILVGSLRVVARLRDGRMVNAQSIGRWNKEISFSRHADTAGEARSNWIFYGVAKEEIKGVHMALAAQEAIIYPHLSLHPKE